MSPKSLRHQHQRSLSPRDALIYWHLTAPEYIMNVFLLFYFLCNLSLITCQPFLLIGRNDHFVKKRLFNLNNSDPLRRFRIGVQRMSAGMRDLVSRCVFDKWSIRLTVISRMVGGRGHSRPVFIQYPPRPHYGGPPPASHYSPYPQEVADFNAYHTGNIEAAQVSSKWKLWLVSFKKMFAGEFASTSSSSSRQS